MAFLCNCELNNLNPLDRNRDIFISNVSIEAFGGRTGQAFETDICTYQTDNNFRWGPVHHAKVLYSSDSENSATKVMFLCMCDTSCHEEIITELQGVEWPVGYGKRLRVEFNRNYTLPHQLLAQERFLQVNSATQTDPDIAATNANPHHIFG